MEIGTTDCPALTNSFVEHCVHVDVTWQAMYEEYMYVNNTWSHVVPQRADPRGVIVQDYNHVA